MYVQSSDPETSNSTVEYLFSKSVYSVTDEAQKYIVCKCTCGLTTVLTLFSSLNFMSFQQNKI